MSLRAARNNLGDVLIRREAIRLVSGRGYSVVALGRDMPDDYLSAIVGEVDCDVIFKRSQFLWQLVCAGLRGYALLVMAPAPSRVASRVKTSLKQLAMLLFLVAWRIAGNRVAFLGRAVRGNAPLGVLIERIISRTAHIYLVRDEISRAIVGRRAKVAPDISMLATRPCLTGSELRNLVAVEVRGDRPGSLAEFSQLKADAAVRGLELVFIAQVAEDAEYMYSVAAVLSCRSLDWRGGIGHCEQEAALGKLYTRCAAVYSDRLHVLINGARHGAFPVVRSWPGDNKNLPTLAAMPSIPYGVSIDGLDEVTVPDDIIEGVREAQQRARLLYGELPHADEAIRLRRKLTRR